MLGERKVSFDAYGGFVASRVNLKASFENCDINPFMDITHEIGSFVITNFMGGKNYNDWVQSLCCD